MDLLNQIFGAFLSAIQGTSTALAGYALPILGACAMLWMTWQGSQELLYGHHGHLGDALAGFLLRILLVGLYMFVLSHWQALCSAILESFLALATAGTDSPISAGELLRKPGIIWEYGQKAAKPIADYDTWARSLASAWNLMTHPLDGVAYGSILAAFLAISLHHGMLLIEVNLAVAYGAVLLPWSLLRPVGHLGEFAVGWISGCIIRAMVSAGLLAIALPLFQLLAPPPSAPPAFVDRLVGLVVPASAPAFTATLALVGGAFLFLLLSALIPARAARLASHALGLTGADILAGAAAGARFGLMVKGLAAAPIRGVSALVSR